MTLQHAWFLRFPAALWIAMIQIAAASAGNVWDGGGSDDYWTTGANWDTGPGPFQFPPVNNGTANIVMPASGGLVQTPLVDVPYRINSLTFANGNGRFVVLCAEELTIGAGGIINNDADIQSVIGPIKLSADQNWNAAAGPLQLENVNLNGFNLAPAGAYAIDMIGSISGPGYVLIDSNYTSNVTMSGGASNTYTGGTAVFGGTLVLQKSGGALAIPGNLNINDPFIDHGAVVRLAADEQISEAFNNYVQVQKGALLDVNTHTETLAQLSIFGTVTVEAAGKLIATYAEVVGATASWTNGGTLYVGDSSYGRLRLFSGGDVSSATGYVGDDTGVTGEVILTDTGSTWNISGYLYVGNRGNGKLTITAGGGVTSGNGRLGNYLGSTGEVVVSGMGSTWMNGPILHVGNDGAGILTINNGGFVSSSDDVTIASGAGANGDVTVEDTGSILVVPDTLIVGNFGGSDGTLRIFNGGRVNSGNSRIADNVGSVGTAIIGGAGSTWNNTGDLRIGTEGDGDLQITADGDVSNTVGYVGRYPGSTGSVTVDGAGSNWTNSAELFVGYEGNGTLEITNGAHVTNFIGIIGRFSGSTSSVTVDGIDSLWTNNGGAISVGYAGAGTLNVTNGGQVTSRYYGFIGDPTGSSQVAMDGAGSAWTIGDLGELDVGTNNGFGRLEITAGGHVTNVAGYVGKYSRGGAASVDGAGSLWTNSGDLFVGETGDGTLGISDGGKVTNTQAYIGWISDKTGAVTVDGAGSTWLSAGDVWIGRGAAHGTLEIKAGGLTSSVNATIADGGGSTGEVTVDGQDSIWDITNELTVSSNFDGGNATLTVTNGGTVRATGVAVNDFGRIHGDGYIVGTVQNSGSVSPGASVGAMSIDGDYTQMAAGELLIELASATSYDELQVSDNATLAGTLVVKLIGGFTPSIGQSFTIVTADDVDDSFTTELLPSVPNLSFDVVYNAQSVVISVVPALPGDYSGDGSVDAADYVLWRKNDGLPHGYNAWRAHFGDSEGSGQVTRDESVRRLPSQTAVPEPRAAMLLIIEALGSIGPIVRITRRGRVHSGCRAAARHWN